jgi:Asp/Glu/hydantoin racemase
MPAEEKKYRFLLIQPFHVADGSKFYKQNRPDRPKEERLMNYDLVKPYLDDVEWDFDPGPEASYGDRAVENREEFAHVAGARLPIVREACESGKYNGIILLGGGEPGFQEAREITRQYGIVATSNAFSQMYIASMLGNRFSVIDFAESHNMYYRNLIFQHRMDQRCVSIRNVGYYHPRPGFEGESTLEEEKAKALRGERSEAVDRAVAEAEAALEEDGAEVITFGCSGAFWLQPFVKKGLEERGWDVPVIEGYACAIELAKMLINLGANASGVTFPIDRPTRRPRRVTF